MRRCYSRVILAAILFVVVVSPGGLYARAAYSPEYLKNAGDQKLRLLFIGNSYTYFNNLPRLVNGLAEAAHKSLETQMIVVGGATLKKHWEDGKAREAIRQAHWDYVVLQEQSTLGLVSQDGPPINDPKMFHEYARLFDAEIRKSGAKTIFFLTWARKNLPQSQTLLTDAYLSIARELKALVAPVGLAWESALKKNPEIDLHQKDLSHPTPAGSYLAACVFYSTLYGKSPVGLTGRILGSPVDQAGRVRNDHGPEGHGGDGQVELVNLNKSEALLLQTTAWQTVDQLSSRR